MPTMTKKPRNRRRSDEAPRNDPNFVTRADLARTRGCSRAAVTMACREGGPLNLAVVGDRIDIRHPAAVAWLAPADVAAKDLLRRKRLAECEKIEIGNAEKCGTLISRELVRVHVIGLLDATNRRLLTDVPENLAMRVPGLVRSGADPVEIRQCIREAISAVVSYEKDAIVKRLRNPKSPE